MDKLPAELKLRLLDFLPKTDLKSMRLVSTNWDKTASVRLWHTTTINLNSVDSQKVGDLLDWKCALRKVRQLNITLRYGEGPIARSKPILLTSILHILNALPQDCLMGFKCEPEVDVSILAVLLKSQARLQKLDVLPTTESVFRSSGLNSLVHAGGLMNLEKLSLYVSGCQDPYSALFRTSLPNLKFLRLYGDSRSLHNWVWDWTMILPHSKLKLVELVVDQVSTQELVGIDFCLDLSTLKRLVIKDCHDPTPLLFALAEEMATVSSPSLEVLAYSNHLEQGYLAHVDYLLRSFSGLKELYINCTSADRLAPEAVVGHGSTLQTLLLNHWDLLRTSPDSSYTTKELQALVTSCPHIQQLGLALPHIGFHTAAILDPALFLSTSHQLSAMTQLTERLTAIAQFPKLHTLRFTSVPGFVGPQGIDPYNFSLQIQTFMNHIADKIMHIFAGEGSQVKALFFRPTLAPYHLPRPLRDTNGHAWPRYEYRRGAITLDGEEIKTVAVPVLERDLLKISPDLPIMTEGTGWECTFTCLGFSDIFQFLSERCPANLFTAFTIATLFFTALCSFLVNASGFFQPADDTSEADFDTTTLALGPPGAEPSAAPAVTMAPPKTISPDITSKLPVEMKGLILEFLPTKADLKNVRLVNKSWGSVAATQLWHEFRTDLCETKSKKMENLINGSEQFLLSVKKLIVASSLEDSLRIAPAKLVDLLCALPHNGMNTFICDSGLTAQALQILLRRQEQLLSISVIPVDGEKISGPPVYNWMKGSLSGVQSIKIKANGYCVSFGPWLSFMTGLKRLHVAGVDNDSFARGWELLPKTLQLPVQELILSNIRLPVKPNDILCCLKLEELKALIINSCTNSVAFLERLMSELAKVKASLEVFGFSHQHYIGRLHPIERFLKSFSGLSELHIDCDQGEPLPPSCLKRHGSTLRFAFLNHQKLWHNHHAATQYYSVADLHAIAKICPKIEQMGVALGRFSVDEENARKMLHLVDTSKQTRDGNFFAKRLEAIAKFPRLDLLRLTTTPVVHGIPAPNRADTRDQEIFMERFASEILGFLTRHGSNIETLVMKPTQSLSWATPPQPDGNGHTWPNFSYQKAAVYMRGKHLRDIAVPITEGKLVERMRIPSMEYESRFDL
ncbi:hypothetical protein BDV96DRAFT_643307 [Lophiotrema nucula]|uniref:F-box domain-containing protein n=1 Tax=Lophiotrema nucula TaxID=690887 RepID=A0A6A5ZLP1_9PLEO|nr:hypothetical protein BDV96DRAFT_643307 [Lophiotrema nucula]